MTYHDDDDDDDDEIIIIIIITITIIMPSGTPYSTLVETIKYLLHFYYLINFLFIQLL